MLGEVGEVDVPVVGGPADDEGGTDEERPGCKWGEGEDEGRVPVYDDPSPYDAGAP